MYGSPLFCLASEREEVLKCVCVWCVFFPLSAAVAVHVLGEGRGTDERRLGAAFLPKRVSVSAAWWPLQTPVTAAWSWHSWRWRQPVVGGVSASVTLLAAVFCVWFFLLEGRAAEHQCLAF